MLRTSGLVAAGLAALCWFGRAATAAAAEPDFVALENQLSMALDHYDAAAVNRVWDERFVFVFPNGRLAHKAERMAGLKPPAQAPAQVLTSQNDSVDVQYRDRNVAVVTVRSTWRRDGVAVGDGFMATHVWIRRGQDWRLLSAQVARIAP